jgi:hypothetical protein
MSYMHNYSVSGLKEPGKMNVLSLEQKPSKGNTFRFDETGQLYIVTWCDEPRKTEFDAALLAINGVVTLRVKLVPEEASASVKSLAYCTALPIDEWNADEGQGWEVISQRPDDLLPCNECGEYTNILIVRRKYETRDLCMHCVMLLGVNWPS